MDNNSMEMDLYFLCALELHDIQNVLVVRMDGSYWYRKPAYTRLIKLLKLLMPDLVAYNDVSLWYHIFLNDSVLNVLTTVNVGQSAVEDSASLLMMLAAISLSTLVEAFNTFVITPLEIKMFAKSFDVEVLIEGCGNMPYSEVLLGNVSSLLSVTGKGVDLYIQLYARSVLIEDEYDINCFIRFCIPLTDMNKWNRCVSKVFETMVSTQLLEKYCWNSMMYVDIVKLQWR